MIATNHRIVFTKLADEPWFIDAAHELRDVDNDVAYTITSIADASDDVWLEKRVQTNRGVGGRGWHHVLVGRHLPERHDGRWRG